MKTRETKQNDLNALTASLANSKSAMVMSFKGLSVRKDQEFRNAVREAGAEYQVVKNTLARIAVKGTDFEQASEHFRGVTAIAWTENDPVVLSKAVSKFMKDNADIYTFKTGVVDGSLVDFTQLNVIANLPSKEELISKLLFVINAQAQRIVTVINAVPRNLAVVIKQIGDQEVRDTGSNNVKASASETDSIAQPSADASNAESADTSKESLEAAVETPTENQEEAASAAPDDAAETAAEPREQAQAPDDQAENILEIPAEEKTE
jgi:large subunit ribosomal protein L10